VKKSADHQGSFRQALEEWWRDYVEHTVFGRLVRAIDAAWSDIKTFFSRPWR
jgi:hypothetical protein